MLKPPDLSDEALWKQRCLTHKSLWARLAAAEPQRGLVCTNASSVNQLYAWSVDTQALRQLTTHPKVKVRIRSATKGCHMYCLDDEQDNELNHYPARCPV